jgi:hypothetical protein
MASSSLNSIASPSFDDENATSTNNSKKKKQLDFYKAMYNFKKMFPTLESDAIETVLRSNNGSVDKTIDQLLILSMDNDSCSTRDNTTTIKSEFTDEPPSYNEFISMTLTNETSILTSSSNSSTLTPTQTPPSTQKPSNSIINLRIKENKSILTGELTNDFLRIRLTSDQVKKIKLTIKKAKRNELTAIINNVIN